jgi:hypothetical protein
MSYSNLLASVFSSPEYRLGRLDFAYGQLTTSRIAMNAQNRLYEDISLDDSVDERMKNAIAEELDRIKQRVEIRTSYYHRLCYDFLERHSGLEKDLRAIVKNDRFVEKITFKSNNDVFVEYDIALEDWYRSQPFFILGKIAEGVQAHKLDNQITKDYAKYRKSMKPLDSEEKKDERRAVERKLADITTRTKNVMLRMLERLVDMPNNKDAIQALREICVDSIIINKKLDELGL